MKSYFLYFIYSLKFYSYIFTYLQKKDIGIEYRETEAEIAVWVIKTVERVAYWKSLKTVC